MRKEYIEDLYCEIWIETSGYEISNKGRIITKHGVLAKMSKDRFGYVKCNVKFDDGFHAKSVHRGCGSCFHPQ